MALKNLFGAITIPTSTNVFGATPTVAGRLHAAANPAEGCGSHMRSHQGAEEGGPSYMPQWTGQSKGAGGARPGGLDTVGWICLSGSGRRKACPAESRGTRAALLRDRREHCIGTTACPHRALEV